MLKCVPHVQHDYLSSFNQSDHFFRRFRCRGRRLCLSSLLSSFENGLSPTKCKGGSFFLGYYGLQKKLPLIRYVALLIFIVSSIGTMIEIGLMTLRLEVII